MHIYCSRLILIFILVFLSGCKSKQDMELTDQKIIKWLRSITDEKTFKKIMELPDKEKRKMFDDIKKRYDPFSDPAGQVTEEQLIEDAKNGQDDDCSGSFTYYYIGRKNNFDYYVQNNIFFADAYKIKVPNNITRKVIPYSKNREKWLILDLSYIDKLANEKYEAEMAANLRLLPKEFKTIKISGDFFSAAKIISKANDKLKLNTPYKVTNTCPEIQVDVLFKNATLVTVMKYFYTLHKLKITVKGNNIILQKTTGLPSPKTKSSAESDIISVK